MLRYALAVLMVIAMAGVASADHKPNHNPGGGEEPTLGVLVVRDSTGAVVGPVLEMGNSVDVLYSGDTTQSSFFETYPHAVLRIVEDPNNLTDPLANNIRVSPTVYWSGLNCSGTPYVWWVTGQLGESDRGFPSQLNLIELPVEETASGTVLYVPIDASLTPQVVEANSRLTENSVCLNGTTTRNFVEMETINLPFVGPYTVGF